MVLSLWGSLVIGAGLARMLWPATWRHLVGGVLACAVGLALVLVGQVAA